MVAATVHPEPPTTSEAPRTASPGPGSEPPAHLLSPAATSPAQPSPPAPLSGQDAAVLLALLDTPGSVAHAATSRGITAEKFLALIASPAARQAIEDVRAFAAARREIRADADREEFTAVLREVAKASPDLVEKRRAATAGLRALDRATGNAAYPLSSPYRSSRRVAGAAGALPGDRRSVVADPYARPWREIRIPRPARSPWEADSSGQPPTVEESPWRPDGQQPDSPAHALTRSPAHSSPPLPSSLPSPSYTALMAADIQLAALRTNDTPEPDSGIATVHGFFPPEIGDYALFAERYRDGLKSLLAPQDVYTLTVIREDRDRALVRAALVGQTSPGGAPAILFHLARTDTSQSRRGDPAGPCWLNTALHFCDTG